jgi:hypothetical protein
MCHANHHLILISNTNELIDCPSLTVQNKALFSERSVDCEEMRNRSN